MRKTSASIVVAAFLVATTCLWRASARQSGVSGTSDLHPQLEVVMSGGVNGSRISMGLGLDGDEWIETTLFAGRRDAPERGMCPGGGHGAMAGGTRLPEAEAPLLVWTVSARLVRVAGDVATVDIRWTRRPLGPQLEPAAMHEGQVRWTLSEGTPVVLDTVRSLAAADSSCPSAALSAEFRVAGATEFNEAAIAYDAWLVQRFPSGQSRTHHMRTTGRQGEKVSFMFPLVTLDGGAASAPGAVPLDLSVAGGVRGRLRTDGSLDLSVDASRFLRTRDGLAIGSAGRTHLSTRPGETVEFEPAPFEGTIAGRSVSAVLRDSGTAIRIRASRAW